MMETVKEKGFTTILGRRACPPSYFLKNKVKQSTMCRLFKHAGLDIGFKPNPNKKTVYEQNKNKRKQKARLLKE